MKVNPIIDLAEMVEYIKDGIQANLPEGVELGTSITIQSYNFEITIEFDNMCPLVTTTQFRHRTKRPVEP